MALYLVVHTLTLTITTTASTEEISIYALSLTK